MWERLLELVFGRALQERDYVEFEAIRSRLAQFMRSRLSLSAEEIYIAEKRRG